MVAWWIPMAVGAGTQLLGNALQPRHQGTQVKPGDPLFDYLKFGKMPGTGGGSSSTTTSSYSRKFDTKTEPYLTPDWKAAGALLRGKVEKKLAAPSSLPAGYESRGIQETNRTFAGIRQALKNRLIAAGVGGSDLEARGAREIETGRGMQLSDFRSGLPLLERQLGNEDLQLASAIMEAFGKGTHQFGTESGTTNSTTNSSFSQSGGLDTNYLQNKIAGGGKAGGGRPGIGDMIGDLGGLAALLLGRAPQRQQAMPDAQTIWDAFGYARQ